MRVDGLQHSTAIDEAYDYVIVGSGAAGASAARVLADTGASIAVVEEGPAVPRTHFPDKVWPAFHNMLRNMGGLIARGRAFIPIIQGSCLGGSTVINSAIMWRVPDDVFDVWRDEFGLQAALPRDALHRQWDRIERELNVHPVFEEALGHNVSMRRAAERLNLSAAPTRRGDRGCQGSARCLTGCPHGAKQSMHLTYLPYAEERGATLFTHAKVERVFFDLGRASGVSGRFQSPGQKGRNFILRARKAVIVAASAIQTPGLLHKSGVRSKHLGKHFQAHPGSPLMAVFDDGGNLWKGATQGFDADEYRADRFKLETISLPPELAFVRMPGTGRAWMHSMAEMANIRVWGVQLRAFAEGEVRNGLFGPDVRFDPNARDMRNLRKALRVTAEMFFAGGAREVILSIHGMPERIRSVDELDVFDRAPDNPAAYSWILSHLFGTARMSVNRSKGVVDEHFAVHGSPNLYVVDSSIFPTNLGVNPQQAIMGIAMHAAENIARRHEH